MQLPESVKQAAREAAYQSWKDGKPIQEILNTALRTVEDHPDMDPESSAKQDIRHNVFEDAAKDPSS